MESVARRRRAFQHVMTRYICGEHQAMKRLCEPLERFFGINYFTYHHIDHEGLYRVLVSRPDWAEHYVNSEYYLHDPYLRHPSCFGDSHVLLWPALASGAYAQNALKVGKEQFDMDHGLMIMDRKADGCHFYGFTAQSRNSNIYEAYLNELPLLRQFITHFHQEAASLLSKVYDHPIDLQHIKGERFFEQTPLGPVRQEQFREQFLQALDRNGELAAVARLSPREKECLAMSGLSCRRIGQELKLSQRTVEHYLDSAKTKLGVSTKEELCSQAHLWKELGLLKSEVKS